MIGDIDISPDKILQAKMTALEAQFKLPLYNPEALALHQQTEIALGEVYRSIMKIKACGLWINPRPKAGHVVVMPEERLFGNYALAAEFIKSHL